MPRIYQKNQRFVLGMYAAVVVDNVDPLQRARVKVNIPSLMQKVTHPQWAQACLPSPEFVTIPPINSTVWVMFEEGDVNRPIWMGAFMQENQPHTEAKSGSPKVRGLKTEETLRISFGDNVKEIQIDTGDDAIITLKKEDKKIIIDAENVFIGTNATEALVRGDTFRELFNSHTHLSSPPGIPTGKPIEQCDPASANTHLSSKHRVE